MTRFALLAILPILTCLVGCAGNEAYVAPITTAHASLLFDRFPAYPSASQIVHDSGWPSTNALYADPEVLFYREYLHDVQGRWPTNRDFTYRRFQLRREGSGIR